MAKTKWVVRIVYHRDASALGEHQMADHFEVFITEVLRYAGCTRVHVNAGNRLVFDILPRADLESETWAKMNASRIQSFGFNAVAAPAMAPYIED